MGIWGTASGFHKCEVKVQAAFAFKFVDQEMMEKVKEVAEVEAWRSTSRRSSRVSRLSASQNLPVHA